VGAWPKAEGAEALERFQAREKGLQVSWLPEGYSANPGWHDLSSLVNQAQGRAGAPDVDFRHLAATIPTLLSF